MSAQWSSDSDCSEVDYYEMPKGDVPFSVFSLDKFGQYSLERTDSQASSEETSSIPSIDPSNPVFQDALLFLQDNYVRDELSSNGSDTPSSNANNDKDMISESDPNFDPNLDFSQPQPLNPVEETVVNREEKVDLNKCLARFCAEFTSLKDIVSKKQETDVINANGKTKALTDPSTATIKTEPLAEQNEQTDVKQSEGPEMSTLITDSLKEGLQKLKGVRISSRSTKQEETSKTSTPSDSRSSSPESDPDLEIPLTISSTPDDAIVKVFICPECFLHTTSFTDFKNHVRKVHRLCISKNILDCVFPLPQLTPLDNSNHSLAPNIDDCHQTGRIYSCKVCFEREKTSDVFLNINDAVDHMLNFHNAGACLNMCFPCKKVYASYQLFRTHIIQCHAPVISNKPSTFPTQFSCAFCPYITNDMAKSQSHLQQHIDTRPFISASKDRLNCGKCSAIFPYKVGLDIHLFHIHTDLPADAKRAKLFERKSFTCPFCQCQVKGSLNDLVDKHCLPKHTAKFRRQQMIICQLCAYKHRFTTFNQFRQHMDNQHSSTRLPPPNKVEMEQVFSCSVCYRLFDSPKELLTHFLLEHSSPVIDKTGAAGPGCEAEAEERTAKQETTVPSSTNKSTNDKSNTPVTSEKTKSDSTQTSVKPNQKAADSTPRTTITNSNSQFEQKKIPESPEAITKLHQLLVLPSASNAVNSQPIKMERSGLELRQNSPPFERWSCQNAANEPIQESAVPIPPFPPSILSSPPPPPPPPPPSIPIVTRSQSTAESFKEDSSVKKLSATAQKVNRAISHESASEMLRSSPNQPDLISAIVNNLISPSSPLPSNTTTGFNRKSNPEAKTHLPSHEENQPKVPVNAAAQKGNNSNRGDGLVTITKRRTKPSRFDQPGDLNRPTGVTGDLSKSYSHGGNFPRKKFFSSSLNASKMPIDVDIFTAKAQQNKEKRNQDLATREKVDRKQRIAPKLLNKTATQEAVDSLLSVKEPGGLPIHKADKQSELPPSHVPVKRDFEVNVNTNMALVVPKLVTTVAQSPVVLVCKCGKVSTLRKAHLKHALKCPFMKENQPNTSAGAAVKSAQNSFSVNLKSDFVNCVLCSGKFKVFQEFAVHFINNHRSNAALKSVLKWQRADVRKFIRSSDLQRYLLQDFTCRAAGGVCDAKFTKYLALIMHLRRQHYENFFLVCCFCGEFFRRLSILDSHFDNVHKADISQAVFLAAKEAIHTLYKGFKRKDKDPAKNGDPSVRRKDSSSGQISAAENIRRKPASSQKELETSHSELPFFKDLLVDSFKLIEALTHPNALPNVANSSVKNIVERYELLRAKTFEILSKPAPETTRQAKLVKCSLCKSDFEMDLLRDHLRNSHKITVATLINRIAADCQSVENSSKDTHPAATNSEQNHSDSPSYAGLTTNANPDTLAVVLTKDLPQNPSISIPLYCLLCGLRFDSVSQLYSHTVKHQIKLHSNVELEVKPVDVEAEKLEKEKETRDDTAPVIPMETTDSNFPCHLCDKRIESLKSTDTAIRLSSEHEFEQVHIPLPLFTRKPCPKSKQPAENGETKRCLFCGCNFCSNADFLSHLDCHRSWLPSSCLQTGSEEQNLSMIQCIGSASRISERLPDRPLVCWLCNPNEIFERCPSYVAHITSHHGLLPLFRCVVCLAVYKDLDGFQNHVVESKHHQFGSFICQVCNFHTTQSELYISHYDAVHQINMCPLLLQDGEFLPPESPVNPELQICQFCGHIFSDNISRFSEYYLHLKSVHTDQNILFFCRECRQNFRSAEAFKNHVTESHLNSTLPFVKEEVHAALETENIVKDLVKKEPTDIFESEISDGLLRCLEKSCDKTFSSIDDYNQHMVSAHFDDQEGLTDLYDDEQDIKNFDSDSTSVAASDSSALTGTGSKHSLSESGESEKTRSGRSVKRRRFDDTDYLWLD